MRTNKISRSAILSALVVFGTTFAASALQGSTKSGLPSAERRAVDPCEQAVKPHGLALGLQAQCEPLGGGGVAKGDFNGDGFGDLAVGVPFEDIGSVVNAGAVNVIYGSTEGLVATAATKGTLNNQFLNQGDGTPGTAEQDDHFGWALASGDFNGDGFSDLAVGIPDEDFGGLIDPGQVYIYQGSASGLTFLRFFDYRDLSGLAPVAYDEFGYSLVWADFNGDTAGDLAIGVPNRDLTFKQFAPQSNLSLILELTRPDAGVVVVLYGGLNGLTSLGMQQVRQGDPFSLVPVDYNPGFGGTMSFNARFGLTLTAGDYDGDGVDDLGVGAPLHTVDYMTAAGQVHVIFGAASGLNANRFVLLDQDSRAGTPEDYDEFGAALASGDFNNDGHDDLAVGVPHEDADGTNTGIVQIFFGATGEFSSFEQTFSQAVFPTEFDGRETGDKFGYSLAAADFNGDGLKDLAIGVPGEDIGTITNAGIVHVVYAGHGLIGCCVGPPPQVWHQGVANVVGSSESGDQFGFALSAWNFGRSAHADLAVGVPYEDVFDAQGNSIDNAGAVQVIYGSASGLATTGNQQWTQNNLNGSASEAGDQFGRAVY